MEESAVNADSASTPRDVEADDVWVACTHAEWGRGRGRAVPRVSSGCVPYYVVVQYKPSESLQLERSDSHAFAGRRPPRAARRLRGAGSRSQVGGLPHPQRPERTHAAIRSLYTTVLSRGFPTPQSHEWHMKVESLYS